MQNSFYQKTTRNRSILTTLKMEMGSMANMAGFSDLVQSFDESVMREEKLMEEYSVNITGVAKEKSLLKADLLSRSLEISARLTSYAKVAEIPVLLKEVRFTKSDLVRLGDSAFLSTIETLYQRAKDNSGPLVGYGLLEEALDTYSKRIERFRRFRVEPRVVRSNKAKIRAQLIEAMRTSDEILDKIDSMMSVLQVTSPDVYQGWLTSKRIINTGRTKITLHGKVTEKGTAEPVPGVKILLTVSGNGSKPAYELMSAPKGRFRLKSLPSGDYDFLATKTGYAAKTGMITIVDKQSTVVELEMEKENK